jgi:hypothetical protein
MDDSPSVIGAQSEREVAYALERAGWHVYLPHFAPHTRVDLIAARADAVVRVQVKTGRVARDAVVFRVCSNTANAPRDYRGEVDAFGIYAPELDRTFLVPIDATGTRTCSLRLEPARSGQVRGTRLAADFELRPPG